MRYACCIRVYREYIIYYIFIFFVVDLHSNSIVANQISKVKAASLISPLLHQNIRLPSGESPGVAVGRPDMHRVVPAVHMENASSLDQHRDHREQSPRQAQCKAEATREQEARMKHPTGYKALQLGTFVMTLP